MTDREKVIKGLECCISGNPAICKRVGCPYAEEHEGIGDTCIDHLMADAIALLKAQEPKLVHVTADINHRKIGECPTCGKSINSGDYPNYCGRCGQAVKWE